MIIFCVFSNSANVPQQEVLHPQWPSIWPRLLTDGKLVVSILIWNISIQRLRDMIFPWGLLFDVCCLKTNSGIRQGALPPREHLQLHIVKFMNNIAAYPQKSWILGKDCLNCMLPSQTYLKIINLVLIYSMRPLTKKNKQYLYECEEERFVFKSCLRKVISLQRTDKHTSWDTAEVANLQLVWVDFG